MKPMVNTIQPSASNDLVSQASMPKTTAATMNRIRASRVIGFSFGWTSVVGDYKRDNRGSEAPEGTQRVDVLCEQRPVFVRAGGHSPAVVHGLLEHADLV